MKAMRDDDCSAACHCRCGSRALRRWLTELGRTKRGDGAEAWPEWQARAGLEPDGDRRDLCIMAVP